MRDPKRIPNVIRSLEAAWLAFPEMRLCQLLTAIHGLDDPFYLEDDKLLMAIRKFTNERAYTVTDQGKALLAGGKS